MDDDGSYAVSILANEVCELLVLEEEFFNKSVKVGNQSCQAAGKLRNEPRHEISNNMVCATSNGSDQPAHMRSLVIAFASRLIIAFASRYEGKATS